MAEIKRGDIIYVNDGFIATGSEQRPGRPAIIVSNDKNNKNSATVEVVYLTTQPKCSMPTHVPVHSARRDSTAICEQITTVSVERLGDYCGHLTPQEMTSVEVGMLISLSLTVGDSSVESPPLPRNDNRVIELEMRCQMLQQMYDSLLNKVLNAR